MKQLTYILKTMRPRQWAKNVFIFAALVFDGQLSNPQSLLVTTIAFLLFCLASSLVYIVNDLVDDQECGHRCCCPFFAGLPGSIYPVARFRMDHFFLFRPDGDVFPLA